MNWQHLFKDHILDRGYDYYYEGVVDEICLDSGSLTAIVQGSEDYKVEIVMREDQIVSMNCSCPYAEDGNNCKHMAAVLISFECDEPDFDEQRTETNDEDSAVVVVSEASEDIVRGFLAQVLKEEENLFARFKRFAGTEISETDMKKYKTQIDQVVRKHQGRNCFIDYHSAGDFIDSLEEFLYEDVQMMLDNGDYREAFELTNYIFLTAGEVDIDDSAGGTGMLADHCSGIWGELLEKSDISDKRIFFEWFIDHLDGSVIDYMEEYIERVFMSAFKEDEFLRTKKEFVDKKVTAAEKDTDSWSRDYQVGNWAMNYISLMKSCGSSWDDIEQYCKKHWSSSAVRKYYIGQCRELGEYGKAIAALNESIKMDSNFRGLLADHSVNLKEIYLLCGEKEQYLNQLWQLITTHKPGDLDIFRELKSQYREDEWIDARDELFSKLPQHSNIDRLFNEEGLYSRLLDYVINSFGLQALNTYVNVLKKHYPFEILRKYRDEVENMAKRASGRSHYQGLVSILRVMKKIPGGNEVVREILLHWQAAYRNRPAMMDELRKL